MVSENIRQLASLLREKAAALESEAMTTCGKTLHAATALELLREKVSSNVR